MMHTLRIEKIIHGGQGLGRLEDGIVAFMPFVLPGEKVTFKETKRKKNYIQGVPQNIIQASPARIDPPCSYYTVCGGCDFQHMTIATQCSLKEAIIRETLIRAGVTFQENTIQPIIVSPDSFHYRYRIRLQVSADGTIGFFQAGSNDIVAINYCHVATDALNKALDQLRRSTFIKMIAQQTKEIELLQSPADERVFCLLHPAAKTFLDDNKMCDHASSLNAIAAIAIKKGKNVAIIDQENTGCLLQQDFAATSSTSPYTLSWTPGCFSQVNAKQNANLVQLVCHLAAIRKGQTVLDLYCGIGNFSIPLAMQGAMVTGIEKNIESIEQARLNAAKMSLENTQFLENDVQKWIRKKAKHSESYNSIIVDPPRQGMGNNISLLAEMVPSKIIYISCDPATLARDIALLQNDGYLLKTVTPIDMFPQTHHIESVALLEKN